MSTTTYAARTWSAQQTAILDWFATGRNHLVARARAGTGKTTVAVEGVKRAPEASILIAAFSKIIQLELESRFTVVENGAKRRTHPHVVCKTLHSVGLACVLAKRRVKWEFDSQRADALTMAVCGSAPDAVKRLVSKLHTKGREIAPHARRLGELTALAIRHECEADDTLAKMGYPSDWIELRALEAMERASVVEDGTLIDGADMIFLPVRNGWMKPSYGLVVVDECQDMTTAQLEIAQGVSLPGGRICVIGDDRQAIFGFRGADSGAIDRLKAELAADELKLTTTYRCGKRIVALAQELVPDFEAGPDNPEGDDPWLPTSKLIDAARPGDYIVSRVNAPLVSTAMKLLRKGTRARVAGRDIGKGLVALLRRFNARSVPDLLGKIESWREREVARITAQMSKVTNGRRAAFEAKIEGVVDQAEMLANLADGAKSVDDILDRVEGLFTDDGRGAAGVVTCSSVHRAKGLEADRVFVLSDTLRFNTDEEQNIAYVAWTRAKSVLFQVSDNVPEEKL